MSSPGRLSRRAFLGGSAAVATGLAALPLLAACASTPAASSTPTAAASAATTPTTAAATTPTAAATAGVTATSGASTPAATAGTTPAAGATAQATTTATAQYAVKQASGSIRWQNRSPDTTLKAETQFITDHFEKLYPNVKVNVETAPDNRDEKLVTAMVGGNAPDVFESWSDNVTQFADKGQVTDVNPLVAQDYTADALKDFYSWQWRDFDIPTAQGTKIRFGMPKYVNVMVLWYNKDMLDKAGVKYPDDSWTHDTYAQAAQKLTIKSGNNVTTFGLQYPVWSWDRYWYKIDAWGEHVVDQNDNTHATFDSAEALAAFEWSRKLMWDDNAMAQRLMMLGTATSYDPNALFAAGRFAMSEDGFYPFQMAQAIQKQFNWAYAHVPPGPKERKVLGTTDGYVIWKGGKQQDASWELLKYLSGQEFQIARCAISGNLPVRFSALADWKTTVIKAYPELESVNLDVGPQAMQMGYPGNRTFFKKDADAQQIIIPALEKVFVSGNTPVTYFKDIATQVTAKMRS